MSEPIELLFFDTFAHDNTEEINLDLVQFPKPVFVTEVRIIPLGARVQADFPGGVRLGATNPGQFQIEFFVNDLGKPGASTFESLGGFEYNQNGCINLDCVPEDILRKIPTDGLVLRGWYTTITLAVYGTLTKSLTEQIMPAVVNPALPTQQSSAIADVQQIISSGVPLENEWQNPENIAAVPIEYQNAQYQPGYSQTQENYNNTSSQEYDYYDVPKDPRNYHHTPTSESQADWDTKRTRTSDGDGRDRERTRDLGYQKTGSTEREHTRPDNERREKSTYSRSHSNERQSRDYHDYYERGSTAKRQYDDRKRPRTPPQSPKRPQTPQKSPTIDSCEVNDSKSDKLENNDNQIDLEEFEPILSDEDILDDNQDYQDSDYDLADYTNNDDLIKLFIPGVNELKKYDKAPNFTASPDKMVLNESFKITISILEDFFKSSITKFDLESFPKLNSEIKEEFIHLCEKLMNLFDNYNNFCDLIKVHQTMNGTGPELKEQVNFIVETLIDWLKIALDYNLANCQDQPPYKIRHIKCGLRLIEFCAQSCEFLKLLTEKICLKIDEILLGLYDQEYMALSIKLMVLKALDSYLLHKYTIDKFLLDNGYKILVDNLRKNPLVRLKFSLNSIMKKLNLYELLDRFVEVCRQLQKNEFDTQHSSFIVKALTELANLYENQFILSQPKRFLPVSQQFEINRTEQRNLLLTYLDMFGVLPCFVVLLTNAKTHNSPLIKSNILELLRNLLQTNDGLNYLASNCDCVNLLVKLLLNNEFFIENSSYNLGLELSYKVQIKYLVDLLFETKQDCDSAEILDQLHNFYCLTLNNIGKKSCAQVLALEDNVGCLLKFINDKCKKSIGLLYIVDLLHLTITYSDNVTFVEQFNKELQQMVGLDLDEQNKLTEIRAYLISEPINLDNIANYVNNVNKQIDNVCSMPGQLICNLRILKHLGISSLNTGPNDPLNNFNELKYKYVVLQLFSLDGTAILTRILTKLCDFYDQPYLHTAFYASNQSIFLLNIIEPCLNLLKHMLTCVIQCYDDFKDLTAVPVLLKTYNLLSCFPSNSQNYLKAKDLMRVIVDFLLVYTQPINDRISENDSLNKTLWTLMVGEILKFVTSAPCTFVSGLLVFSELLPLPLPIQTRVEVEKSEVLWLINLRKLWSAHLHPHQTNIQEMIAKLCTTANQQLLNLLRRVCVQLADLSANTALVVAKGVLDVVFEHFTSDLQFCSGTLCKILNFLACLVTHNTLKCAVLYLTNSVDKYPNLIQIFARFLKVSNQTNTHIQAQECILSIFQSFCDVEITLLTSNLEGKSSETYLANALPTKDNLLVFLGIMVEHLSNNGNGFVTYLPIMRTFLLLTEHDYGFYYLKENLLKIKSNFCVNMLNKFVRNFSKDNADCLSTLNTFVEFLRVCCCISSEDETLDDVDSLLYTPRTAKLNFDELRELVGWGSTGDEVEEKHAFVVLEEILKKLSEEDDTFESLLENVSTVIKLLNTENTEPAQHKETAAPELPEPESLLSQFSSRTIYTLSSTDICSERLTIHYWLTSQNDDISDLDTLIQCDLTEICRQCLPADYSLIKELEKLCKINSATSSSASNDNEESQKQKKMKKPYITPMRNRGFPRTIQQRSDLFRSRPPNTSRPPSLHVDDFVALETCGAQPTGPTGYNKFSRELLASTRIARGSSRGRAFVTSERSMQCRQMSWWGTGLGRSPY